VHAKGKNRNNAAKAIVSLKGKTKTEIKKYMLQDIEGTTNYRNIHLSRV